MFDATRNDWGQTYKAILNQVKYKGVLLGKSKTIYNLFFEIDPNEVFILPEKNWKWAFVELFDRFDDQYENPGHSYQFRPHWKAKLDKEGGTFVYNYNDRLWPSVEEAIRILKQGKLDRDAVVSVWRLHDISREKGTRTPCTLNLHFYIDNNDKVNLNVNMRTNDVVNLLIYDVFHHSMVLQYVASSLDMQVGKYSHFTPLAYYQKKREERGYIDRLVEEEIRTYRIESDGIPVEDFDNFVGSCHRGVFGRRFFATEIMEDITGAVISLLFNDDSIKFKNQFFNKVFKRGSK